MQKGGHKTFNKSNRRGYANVKNNFKEYLKRFQRDLTTHMVKSEQLRANITKMIYSQPRWLSCLMRSRVHSL